ncbi:LacI family DNA-binding transcriptional regulator [Leifsonia sp. TF02-11]|uniref:LacI family DNA-binding transcriptional regulator n=1 Tax=Leifsonia sp. TF02-11 TaxID=2815212 RepID=UPI001AA1174B|nr:LacI family DNA-binding transcriptional regulator [Leifsonia sp. TF02-11]MBN9632835.1 LacI family DNA-binding transcriptional regulator [Actinomycetota bacterium]MBO1737539.1 LacI family DNA-binding transcriptional regulator [Leifsonia sp. TF02-11]
MSTEQVDGRSVPTLEAVAARAGVSRATVSRVVNGSPKVKPEVAEAVTRAIADLNYVPNRAARSLASRRTQVIALVVPESTAKVFADPFFASIVQGVALSLADTEYTLNMVISSETNPDKTRRYLMGGNVDGALVVSHHSGDHSYAQLGSTLPIVFGGRPVSESQHESYFVDVDNVAGSAGAAEHLIARGRRNIALITGPQDMPAGLDRFTGWRDALQAHGLDTSLVEYGDFSPYSGMEAMRRLLATGRPIDGLFAANDQMAAGAYSAIHEAGLDIPRDIAVVGFDDDNFGLTATPPLTTVHQPSIGLGETMARVLVRRLAGEPVDRVTLLPTELVVRQSS